MPPLTYTPLEEIDKIHAHLRAGFKADKLTSIAYRKYQLTQLVYLLKDNMSLFEEALKKDLGRPVVESRFLEIVPAISEALTQIKNVEKWSKPSRPPFNLNFFPMKPLIRKEPKGVVLIMSPFNYPVYLTLAPLAGAIAAGNAVAIKPPESTPATTALMTELAEKYLDNDLVRFINGAVPEATRVLELQWDHILYTGGSRVARIVSTAAAKFLTPVTLELGGKSPVIMDPQCDLKLAAKRIMWGKVVNAGQTCVAPDYILVPRSYQDTFVQALKEVYEEFYPDTEKHSAASDAFSRLVSPQAHERVAGLLERTKGKIVFGGEVDKNTKFISPTVVKDVGPDDSLMSEEIFGPILPVVPVEDLDAAIKFVNDRDHPLALYVFTQNSEVKAKVFNQTQSGAVVANETIVHTGAEGMPFGGIGPSGHGMYTGQFSFDSFSHFRTTLDSPGWLELILKFRYPPYNKSKESKSLAFLGSLPKRPTGPPTIGKGSSSQGWRKWFFLALAVAIVGGFTRPSSLENLGSWIPQRSRLL